MREKFSAGSRTEELRGIFPCSSLVSRGFAVQSTRGTLSESCRQGRSECWLSRRQSPVSILKCRRLISNDVRARASECDSDAELDPRGGGDKLVRVISKDAEVSQSWALRVKSEFSQSHVACFPSTRICVCMLLDWTLGFSVVVRFILSTASFGENLFWIFYVMVLWEQVSVLSLVATEVVREAQQRHNASPTVCSIF